MNTSIKDLTLSACFLTLGLLLPFVTGQVPVIGSMLLPMHIPVFFCGLICGWKYGLLTGLITPLLRSVLFGMPVMYPMALSMAFELAVYGFVSGWIYDHVQKQDVKTIYISLISAMLAGRLAWGLAMLALLGIHHAAFPFSAFIAGAFTSSIPGILLQLLLIPAVLVLLNRSGLVRFHQQP